MSLHGRWIEFKKLKVRTEPDHYGVYELSDRRCNVLYIGQGKIHSRLLAHFGDGSDPFAGISYYRKEFTYSKTRAEQRERAEIKLYKIHHNEILPKYNHRVG